MRRVHDWDNRVRTSWSGWIEWIGEQVIIEDILIAPEAPTEAVYFPLLRAHAGQVVGIAAIPEVAEEKIVEEKAFMVR